MLISTTRNILGSFHVVQPLNIQLSNKPMEKEKQKCLMCEETFVQKNPKHVCCSPRCNSKKKNEKLKQENKIRLQSISRICKSDTCNNIFSTTQRIDQLFCSTKCCERQGKRDYKTRNPEKIRATENRRKKFKYHNDPIDREKKINASNTRYHKLTPEEKKERGRKGRLANPQKTRDYAREYHSRRSKEDINFKLANNLSSLIRSGIKRGGGKKSRKTIELLGCSIEVCRKYIQDQFATGMNWSNHGEWEIDHVKPISTFDLTKKSQQLICFNYKNLQPLWKQENNSKLDTFRTEDKVIFFERFYLPEDLYEEIQERRKFNLTRKSLAIPIKNV